VISLFAKALQTGRAPAILGDGLQTRDFVCVSDVVEANLRAASVPAISGESLNIGTGRAVSILELFAIMCDAVDVRFEPRFGPSRHGEVRHSVADAGRALKLLGWKAKVSLEEGIRQMLRSIC
jgi:nucleoside-diphosphate-sugar epimerase